MNELVLFAGAGGGILASKLLGWNTVGAVEIEKFPRDVLLSRQRDGVLPKFPIWDDVRTFDGKPWRGLVDVISGGFPCQDISVARTNRPDSGKPKGLKGEKSGLWTHMARVIKEIRPQFAFIENSSNLRSKGLDTLLKCLNSMGYDARWCVLGSRDVSADHVRERMWILANAHGTQRQRNSSPLRVYTEFSNTCSSYWREAEPGVERIKDGMANRLDRLKAIGNGQDARVAALAFTILSGGLNV